MTKLIDLYEKLPDVVYPDRLDSSLGKTVTKRTVSRAVRRYERQGLIARLKRGVYAKTTANQFLVAEVFYNGYIGFSSALYLYGLKTEVDAAIEVCVPKGMPSVSFMNTKILPVNVGKLFYGTAILNDVTVSTYAKTIFDMLYRPRYANFFDMFRALNQRSLTGEELLELLHYLNRSGLSTIRRAGYVLEDRAPKWFVRRLEKMSARTGSSFFVHNISCNFNKRWRIYDDANVKRWDNAV